MQNSQLDRLLKLAKRTGDRLIVTSNDGAEPVVILPLAEYEGMLDAMTFFRSKPADGGKDQDFQERAAQYAEEPAVTPETAVDPDEAFDPVALERQVMAAMAPEEPSVVPVEAGEVQSMPTGQETVRKPISRKVNPTDDGGEERFYLEAV